jgi:ABC-type dipeptide/oligopeptide/nickel transport system permease component
MAMLMAILVGIPMGLVGGFNPGSVVDTLGRGLALLGQSIPNFWLAMILILYFSISRNMKCYPFIHLSNTGNKILNPIFWHCIL